MFALYNLAATLCCAWTDEEGFPTIAASDLLMFATQLDDGLGNIYDSWSSFCFINRWNEEGDYTPAEQYLIDHAIEMAQQLGD